MAVLLGAGLVVFGAGCRPPPPPPPPPTVIVYGDSFLTQAQSYVAANAARAGWDVVIRQFPGTALCDWLPNMSQDAATIPNVEVVVLTFTGNMLTPCTLGRGDDTTVYTADANTAAAFWAARGVRVGWVAPPGQVGTTGPHPLAAVYESVAASHGQAYADGGVELHDSSDTWPVELPCLSFDVSAGACGPSGDIQVRFSPTNGHLCDVDSGDAPCPVYSSGVVRWGGVVASLASSLMG